VVKEKEHRWNVGAPIVGHELENSRDLFARHVELFDPDDLAGRPANSSAAISAVNAAPRT
jgi:hypothetical protein